MLEGALASTLTCRFIGAKLAGSAARVQEACAALAVADGCGSASRSDIGAELTVEVAVDVVVGLADSLVATAALGQVVVLTMSPPAIQDPSGGGEGPTWGRRCNDASSEGPKTTAPGYAFVPVRRPMLEGVTIEQLRTFRAVVEAGSFSAAARKLGRVQAAVSQSIDRLDCASSAARARMPDTLENLARRRIRSGRPSGVLSGV
jgi:hypothetical protein